MWLLVLHHVGLARCRRAGARTRGSRRSGASRGESARGVDDWRAAAGLGCGRRGGLGVL